MAKIELKQPIVEEISAAIKDAATVVIVNYSGITVAQDTQLRKQLREAGVVYKVYKNTLMKRAFQGTDLEPLCEHLFGANAIAVSKDDPVAAARIIKKHLKNNPTISMVAAVAEGKYYDAAGVTALADIPSRDELLGRLLGSIQSPITNFARVLKQIAEKQPEGEGTAEAAPAEA